MPTALSRRFFQVFSDLAVEPCSVLASGASEEVSGLALASFKSHLTGQGSDAKQDTICNRIHNATVQGFQGGFSHVFSCPYCPRSERICYHLTCLKTSCVTPVCLDLVSHRLTCLRGSCDSHVLSSISLRWVCGASRTRRYSWRALRPQL